jgi:hypothetical protein
MKALSCQPKAALVRATACRFLAILTFALPLPVLSAGILVSPSASLRHILKKLPNQPKARTLAPILADEALGRLTWHCLCHRRLSHPLIRRPIHLHSKFAEDWQQLRSWSLIERYGAASDKVPILTQYYTGTRERCRDTAIAMLEILRATAVHSVISLLRLRC